MRLTKNEIAGFEEHLRHAAAQQVTMKPESLRNLLDTIDALEAEAAALRPKPGTFDEWHKENKEYFDPMGDKRLTPLAAALRAFHAGHSAALAEAKAGTAERGAKPKFNVG